MVNAKALRQELLSYGWVPRERVRLIYNGIDPAAIDRADAGPLRTELGAGPGDIVVLTAARLVPEKGHLTLLEAARAAGTEPEVRQKTWQLDLRTLLRLMGRHDPLRPLRRILAWVPRVLFLAIFCGGILLGYFEPSLGPIWGGIFGMVLGAFFYKMTRPPDWWNRL